MVDFGEKVAIVTGAGHGIGRACALRLAREGARIVALDIDLTAVDETLAMMRSRGGDGLALRCDLTSTESVNAAVASASAYFGRIDVLVNTAGGDTEEPAFHELTDETWDRMLDLNLTSVMRTIRASLPHLIQAPGGASVVSIGSVNGMTAMGSYPYSSAKGALEILTRNLAAEYGPQGVRVNLIVPATIRTRVWDSQPESLARLAKMYPLQRVGEPDDIAAAVSFLSSNDASWITGVTLPVDGGLLTGPRAYLAGSE